MRDKSLVSVQLPSRFVSKVGNCNATQLGKKMDLTLHRNDSIMNQNKYIAVVGLNVTDLDRSGLHDFIKKSDKRLPPAFVGREDVLADIVGTADRAWEERDSGSRGETRIVQGAPGAGKTSVLLKLEEDLNSKVPLAEAPRVLLLNSTDISFPSLVIETLAEMADNESATELLAGSNTTDTLTGSLGGLGFGLGGQTETSKTKSEPPPVMYAFDRWLAKLPPGRGLRGPIIVAVDEIQNVKNPDSLAAEFLRSLHDGKPGRPITLVMAGLSDSEQAARRLGMTRGIHVHRIGCFNGDESMSLMTSFCDHFGIEIGSCLSRLGELAGPTDGWPRHLHWALVSLCKAVLVAEVDGKLDRIENWEKVKSDSNEARNRYYMSQRSNEMVDSSFLVGAVMKQLREDDTPFDVKQSIEANIGATIPWRLPDAMNVHQFYDHLIHQGAIEESKNGTVCCPIPSFRVFLIERGSRQEHERSKLTHIAARFWKLVRR